MTLPRFLVAALAALLALALAAPALADDSGGAAAEIFLEGEGGGIVMPGERAPVAPQPSGDPTAPPPVEAEAAQEETPTTPEGEEQPPDELPDEEEEETDNGMGPVDELPEDGAPNGESAGDGFLPRTGFELAAMTSIGLGLLLAGAALWPTSSWPPAPRGPSRSTTRR
jgi:hypothetical protein